MSLHGGTTLLVTPPVDFIAAARRYIKARTKQLALMVHPDAGGATEEMVKINKAAEALLKEVKP